MIDSRIIKSEDERRALYEYVQNRRFKSAKVVIAKESIPVGDHYHNKKDELFFLLTGSFIYLQVGELIDENVSAPIVVDVPRCTYHKFILEPGSILLGVASEPFDPEDEIKLQE